MTATAADPTPRWRVGAVMSQPAALITAGVLALVLVACGGYLVGEHRANGTRTLTGTFYVGDHQASAPVGGWWYGVTESVEWVDAGGSLHEGGWPVCLGTSGHHVRARFGEVTVTGPDDSGSRPIVRIDCRGASVSR